MRRAPRTRTAAAVLAALALAPALHAADEGVLLSLEQGYETLDGDRPEWKSTALGAAWSGTSAAANVEWREVSRFGVSDRQGSIGGSGTWHDITLAVEASGSPDHELLPEYAAGFDLGVPVAKGLLLHAGARRAAYTQEDATLLRGGLEYYVGPARLAYTVINGRLESGESGTAHVIQADDYYGAANRVGLVAATGGEATRIDPNTVVVADVLSAAVVGRHWIHGPWGVSYVLSWTEQGDFYTRWGGVLGLIFRL